MAPVRFPIPRWIDDPILSRHFHFVRLWQRWRQILHLYVQIKITNTIKLIRGYGPAFIPHHMGHYNYTLKHNAGGALINETS